MKTVSYFFGGWESGSYKSGVLKRSTVFEEVSTDVTEAYDVCFYKSDYRLGGTFYYSTSQNGTTIPEGIVKYAAKTITVNSSASTRDDMTTRRCFTYSAYRTTGNVDANWIVYRASDPILMKAEALASLAGKTSDQAEASSLLYSAYELVHAVFLRSNPTMLATKDIRYGAYSSPSDMLEFIYRERQREFYGEGKRWFDLVRMAYRSSDTSNMLSLLVRKFAGGASAVRAKMATMNSLFNPVYREEIKVNPALIQNPAWEDDRTSTRN